MITDFNVTFLLFPQANEIRCPKCNRLAGTVLGLCMFVTVCKRCGTRFVWPSLQTQEVEDLPPSVLKLYAYSSAGKFDGTVSTIEAK